MDYLKIIWQGYNDEENKVLNMWDEHEYLENYFFRECKKAEKEFFEADEFFECCLHVVENLDDLLVFEEISFNDRKNELELLHDQAKKGLLQYENMEGKTIEQKRQETIEYCKHELTSISENDHCIKLEDITNGKIRGILYKDDLLQIKLAIQNAFQKCESNMQPSQKIIITKEQSESYRFTDSNLGKVKALFDNIFDGKMSRLDIFNAIDEITDSNLDKIKALEDDFEMYLGKAIYRPFLDHPPINFKEKREETVLGIKLRNKEICKIKLPKSIGKDGGVITPAAEFFNLEDTSSPDKYFSVCKVINDLKGKIENFRPKKKQETKLSDFFYLDKIGLSKVNEIQQAFKGKKGKPVAGLIHLLRDRDHLIEIIPSSKTKNLKKFYELVTGNSGTYEAVRKCFDEKNNWNYLDTDDDLLSENLL